MEDLGARLRQAREQRGVPLKTIAARTKISVAALEALERNDFSRLPGGIFGRAFVRAYAVEIGLDPETTVADFQEHLDWSEREAAAREQTRVEITDDDREFLVRQQRAIRVLRVAAIVVAVVVTAALVWQARRWWTRSPAEPAPIEAVAAEPSVSVPPPLPSPSGATSLPETAEPVPATPEPRDEGGAGAPEPSATPSAVPAAASGASAPLVVEFTLTAECWVVASIDGGRSVSQLLQAGDSRRFEAERSVFLDLGNAGAVELTINGVRANPLGPAGRHIQRTITVENAKTFLPPG